MAIGEVMEYHRDFHKRLIKVDVRAVSYTYDALTRLVGQAETDGTGAVDASAAATNLPNNH